MRYIPLRSESGRIHVYEAQDLIQQLMQQGDTFVAALEEYKARNP